MHRANMMSEVMTVFNSESLAPYDIIVKVEVSLRSTELTVGIRSWMEGLLVPRGRPRYVNGMLPILHSKILASSFVRSASQFIGMSVDL